jgi:integrase
MWYGPVSEYVAHLRAAGRAVTTIRLREQHLARAFSWLGAAPYDVTADDLVGYLAAHEWAPETRKSIRSSLRGFYVWAVESGRLEADPSARLPRVTVTAPVPHPTPDAVFAEAKVKADDRVLLMLNLAALAGLRRAEVATLHTDNLVGDDLFITGKGGKERRIPAHPILADALRALPRGYVFPGADGGHLSPDRVGRLMAAALPGDWTAHSLRHRFATRAFAGQRDLLTVQQLLGHSSVATTQRYTQVPDDALRRAVIDAA